MNASTPSVPSVLQALRHSVAAVVQACRQMGSAVREAASAVATAAAEDRAVVRSICAAVEQIGRTGIRATHAFQERSVTAWRRVPRVGLATSWTIVATAWVAAGVFSMMVVVMIVCDVALNTARTERVIPEPEPRQ